AEQIEDGRGNLRVAAVRFERAARVTGRFDFPARIEHLRSRLEFLILEQPLDELGARVLVQIVLTFRLRVGRQQQLRFDVYQGRSHHEEIPRDGDVQLLHDLEIRKVLFGNVRDGDVVNVNLVFSD